MSGLATPRPPATQRPRRWRSSTRRAGGWPPCWQLPRAWSGCFSRIQPFRSSLNLPDYATWMGSGFQRTGFFDANWQLPAVTPVGYQRHSGWASSWRNAPSAPERISPVALHDAQTDADRHDHEDHRAGRFDQPHRPALGVQPVVFGQHVQGRGQVSGTFTSRERGQITARQHPALDQRGRQQRSPRDAVRGGRGGARQTGVTGQRRGAAERVDEVEARLLFFCSRTDVFRSRRDVFHGASFMVSQNWGLLLLLVAGSAGVVREGGADSELADGVPVSEAPAILKLADGTRFFPVGISSLPGKKLTDAAYQQAIDAGFNAVTDHEGRGRLRRILTFPERRLVDGDGRHPALDFSVEPVRAREALEDFVAQHENDADLAVWQGPDESNYFPFSPRRYPTPVGLAAGYRYVAEQSRHPVWSNLGPTGVAAEPANLETNRPLLASSDAWSIDIYPVPLGQNYQESPYHKFGLAQGGQFVKTLRRQLAEEGQARKPVWMWLQGFGWSDFERADWEGRRPTYEEARFMTFDAIINGCTGVLYYGTGVLESDSQYWADLRKVASEVNELMPAWLGSSLEATADQPEVEAVCTDGRKRPGDCSRGQYGGCRDSRCEVAPGAEIERRGDREGRGSNDPAQRRRSSG